MDEQITVARSDLEVTLAWQGLTTIRPDVLQARDRLRAALRPPEPPWEPSEAMVEIMRAAHGITFPTDAAEAVLVALHDAGFDLREQQ